MTAEMQNPTPPIWLPVTEAEKLLNLCCDRNSALRDLDDLIARGGVRVWATGVTSLHRGHVGSSRQPSGPVQPATWATIRGGALEAAMWATGVVTLAATSTATGIVLKGIRIQRDPFLQLLEEYSIVPPAPATNLPQIMKPAAPYAPTDLKQFQGWDLAWAAVVTLAIDERLHRAEFPSQAKLMAAVRDTAKNELYSDRILKPFISKVFKEFVQP